jgi:hypothetical protein
LISQSNSYAALHRLTPAQALRPSSGLERHFREERIMSLTFSNSNEPNASGSASKKNATYIGSAPIVVGWLQKMFAAAGRLCLNIFDAIAEARAQKAMIEAELYLNRYRHTSKNDDDLPIVR